jgi:hypothetical protein
MKNATHILLDEALRAAASRFLETQVEKSGSEALDRLSRGDDPELVGYLDVVLSELALDDFEGALLICSYLGGMTVEMEGGATKVSEAISSLAKKLVTKCFRSMVAEIAVLAGGPGGWR